MPFYLILTLYSLCIYSKLLKIECEWKTSSPPWRNDIALHVCIAQKMFYSKSTRNSIHNTQTSP